MLPRTSKKRLDELLQKLDISKHSGYFELKLGREESRELYDDFLSLFGEIEQKNKKIIELQDEIILLQKKLIESKENQVIEVIINDQKGF